MFRIGDCLRINSGEYPNGSPKRHPFVVITEFDADTGEAILVSFSSTEGKEYFDTTLVVQPGVHPFITQQSYAAYYLAGRMSQEELEGKIKRGEAEQGKPISPKLLQLLRAGVLASDDTPKEIQDFYEDILYKRIKPAS